MGLLACLWNILLITDWCGSAYQNQGWATPGKVVLGCKKKQVERTIESEPVSIFPPMASASVLVLVLALTSLYEGLKL